MPNRVSFLTNALPAPVAGAPLLLAGHDLPAPPTTLFPRPEWGMVSMTLDLPQPLDVKILRQPDGLLVVASCRCGAHFEALIDGLTVTEAEWQRQTQAALTNVTRAFLPLHGAGHDAVRSARRAPETDAHEFIAAVTSEIEREGIESVMDRIEVHLLLSNGQRARAPVPFLPSFDEEDGRARVAASVAFAYGVRTWLKSRSLRAVAALLVTGGKVTGSEDVIGSDENPVLVSMLVTRSESLGGGWRGVQGGPPGVLSWAWAPGVSPYILPGIVTK